MRVGPVQLVAGGEKQWSILNVLEGRDSRMG